MKRILLTLLLTSAISSGFAQWSSSGGNTFITTGNVGIGTSTPLRTLDVNGQIQTNNGVIFNNGKSWDFSLNSNNLFLNETAVQTRLALLAGGNIGIGTISPASLLHLQSTNTPLITLSKTGIINWKIGNFDQSTDNGFTIGFNATKLFYISNSGYVGIGTISPNTILSVSGTGSNSNGILNLQSSDAAARGTLLRTGFYEYTSQDNSGTYFQAWGMRLNGVDNLWYRTYTSANNYLPYTALTTGGTIVFGGATSNLTTDANPTLNPSMTINVGTGNVGIGSVNPQNKLDVNGTIHSKSVLVDLNGWSDFVFKKDYPLLSLSEVKAYIDQNQHLPGIPSEQEMIKNGLNVSEMNELLMKKVEELTLYLIEKDKKEVEQIKVNIALQKKFDSQQLQIEKLQKLVNSLLGDNSK